MSPSQGVGQARSGFAPSDPFSGRYASTQAGVRRPKYIPSISHPAPRPPSAPPEHTQACWPTHSTRRRLSAPCRGEPTQPQKLADAVKATGSGARCVLHAPPPPPLRVPRQVASPALAVACVSALQAFGIARSSAALLCNPVLCSRHQTAGLQIRSVPHAGATVRSPVFRSSQQHRRPVAAIGLQIGEVAGGWRARSGVRGRGCALTFSFVWRKAKVKCGRNRRTAAEPRQNAGRTAEIAELWQNAGRNLE